MIMYFATRLTRRATEAKAMRRIRNQKTESIIGGLMAVLFGIALAWLGLNRFRDNLFSLHHSHVFGTVLTKTPTRPGKYGAHDFLCDVEFKLPNADVCQATVFVRLDDLAVVGGPIELVPRDTCANPVVVVHVSSAPYWCGSALAFFFAVILLWAAFRKPAALSMTSGLQDT